MLENQFVAPIGSI